MIDGVGAAKGMIMLEWFFWIFLVIATAGGFSVVGTALWALRTTLRHEREMAAILRDIKNIRAGGRGSDHA